jgi:hypothetical protein
LNCECFSCPGHTQLRGGENRQRRLLHLVQAPPQTDAVGELYGEAGTRVELEQDRTTAAVDHQIDAQIAQPFISSGAAAMSSIFPLSGTAMPATGCRVPGWCVMTFARRTA